jgi:hypothetical protein
LGETDHLATIESPQFDASEILETRKESLALFNEEVSTVACVYDRAQVFRLGETEKGVVGTGFLGEYLNLFLNDFSE